MRCGCGGGANTQCSSPDLIHTTALATCPSRTSRVSSYTGSAWAAAHCGALRMSIAFGAGTVPA